MNKSPLLLLIIAAAGLLNLCTANAQVLISDGFDADTLSSYNTALTRTTFLYSTSNGVDGGAGRLNVNGTSTSGAIHAATIDSMDDWESAHGSVRASISFLTANAFSGTNGINIAGAAIGTNATSLFDSNPQMELIVRGTGSSGNFNLRLRSYFAANGSNTEFSSASPTNLSTNTWYNLAVTISHAGSNLYDVEGVLTLAGTSTVVHSLSQSGIANAGFDPTANLYAGFLARQTASNQGVLAVDNFVVPEPGAASLLLAGALAFFTVRRRPRV